MNRDAAPAYLQPNEVYERRNARVNTVNGKNGFNTTLNGTTLLGTYTGHTALASIEDIKRNRMIMFLKDNVGGSDKIIAVSNTITTLYNSTVFNFGDNLSCDIIDDWIVFLDNENPPRKLNIVTPITVDQYNCQLAVRPPRQSPSVTIGSDSSRKVNLLLNKTFQFATQFIYKGYEYSTISQYSELCVSPTLLFTSDMTYTDNSIGNFITVSFDYGTSDVLKVRVVCREGNTGNWFIVDEIDRPNVTDYYPVSISFYNDKARKNIPANEALLFYSDVPILAEAVSVVKNRVALANVVKGYDTTEAPASYSVEYGDVSLSAIATPFVISWTVDAPTYSFIIGIDLPLGLTTGDIISILFEGTFAQYKDDPSWERRVSRNYQIFYSFTYQVQSGDTYPDIIEQIRNDINSKGASIVASDAGWDYEITTGGVTGLGYDVAIQFVNGYRPEYYDLPLPGGTLGLYQVDISQSCSVMQLPSNYVTFHSGSYRNVGMLFYDAMGRTSGVLNEQRIYIPSNGERAYSDAYKQARIRFLCDSITPPSWAVSYRFAVSESVNLVDAIPFVSWYASAKKIFDTYIDNTPVFAIALPDSIAYEYTNGDYMMLEQDSGSAITTIIKNIIGTRVEIEDGGTTYAGLFLIIPKSGSEVLADFEGNVGYIMKPKSEVSDVVYFEDYNTYLINNGELSTTTGLITCGDTWFVQRDYKWDSTTVVTKIVEDFFISRSLGVAVYSKGRPIVDFGDLGRQKRLQHVVWSKQYLDNTKINGLAMFESTSRVELDEKNGEITGFVLNGDILKVVQEDKETSLYIGKQQVTNADGTLTLTSTANFIGTVYPLGGNFGTSKLKSVVVNDGVLYYWDSTRGSVVRSSNNGQEDIANRGMTSYFYALKQTLDSASWVDVVFHFDRRYSELFCTFSWKIGTTYYTDTVVYSELLGGWSYFYDLSDASIGVSAYGRIGESNYIFCSGKLYELDSNSSNNTICGAYKPLSIVGYVNISPTQEKVLKSIMLDSGVALTTSFESDVANTREKGNYTVLVPESYRKREGLWCSSVYRNIRLASGATNLSQLYSGNLMTGKWFKITLTKSSGNVELRFVDVGFNISQ